MRHLLVNYELVHGGTSNTENVCSSSIHLCMPEHTKELAANEPTQCCISML
jgi:hypothetical protein